MESEPEDVYNEGSSENDDLIENQIKKQKYKIPKRKFSDSFSVDREDVFDKVHKKFKKDDGVLQTPSTETESESKKDNLSVAEKLMLKLGYEKGKGLGKNLQGISEPIAASNQKGRRGLGLELKELKKAAEFDPQEEIINIKETVDWFISSKEQALSLEDMTNWIQIGSKKDTIEDEDIFCDKDIISDVLTLKSALDKLNKNEIINSRFRSNPFETIRNAFFMNRAALKMAEIDKACDFMFRFPQNIKNDELIYFADVCAGPGGFSEYILWRRKWYAKGFGFTLKDDNDFKLGDFLAGPSEVFHPYYGPKEDGDVYDSENQLAFRKLIMSQTKNLGVHFMMADGGFSCDGKENIQELLSKRLYLCQCLVALMIVRHGGHFVTKLFDVFTPFSIGLIYLMNQCFEKISIFKPNTSRPANSERYLICKNKKENVEAVARHLFHINKQFGILDADQDVMEIVPLERLRSDENFFLYMKNSNNKLGEKQIVSLKKLAAYIEDKNLIEEKQMNIRKACLEHWEIPDLPRGAPKRLHPGTQVDLLLKDPNILKDSVSPKNIQHLTKENLGQFFTSKLDWYCALCASYKDAEPERQATFFLGQGKHNVFRFENGRWNALRDPDRIELPANTLVYGEIVMEYRKEGRSQTKWLSLHIIDAYSLGSEVVAGKFLEERNRLIQLFTEAIWKPYNSKCMSVRVKELFPIEGNLTNFVEFKSKTMKNNKVAQVYCPALKDFEKSDGDTEYFYVPNTVMFLKAFEKPWCCHVSKSQPKPKKYFFNKDNKLSRWELPNEACANFKSTLKTKVLWNWSAEKKFPELIELMNN